jgi:hypothetical protein
MTAHTRSMVACLEGSIASFFWQHASRVSSLPEVARAILLWQRAKACRDQRLAMQITDDKTLDELEQIEHETRLAARSACEAVGIDWRTLGEIQ